MNRKAFGARFLHWVDFKNRIKLWKFNIIEELSNNPLKDFDFRQKYHQVWNSITGITIVYTHLLCHTASLSRAWQVSRRHVLHFRWDLCFIRIAYHEAPVWSEQSHRSKVVMNPRKIKPFKTWKKSQEKYQVPRRHVLQFRWDLCIIRISYHIAPVPSNHTVQNLNWIQEKSYCSKLDIKAKKMSYQIIKKYSLIFFSDKIYA